MRMIKSTMMTVTAAALGGVLLSVGVASVAGAEDWDMPMGYADSNFHTDNAKAFAECVATSTEGALTFTIHASGSLFGGADIKRAVQTGQALIGERLLSAHQNEDPIFGVDSVPFLAASFDDAAILWDATRPVLERVLDEQNLVLLYSVPWPPQGFYFNKPVNSLADAQGIKFRTYNAAGDRMAELAGMLPVKIEAAELNQALSTGVADGFVSSGSTGYDRKVWEFLSHFYEADAWLPRNHVFANKDAWNGLSADIQSDVRGCAALAEYSGTWRAVHYTVFTLDALASNGMEVGVVSSRLKGELEAIGATMTDEWLAAAGADGAAIVEAYKAAR
ncbi:MAG: TRAP transporter substrate-binding protein [Alphaproteobacteria bacterium]